MRKLQFEVATKMKTIDDLELKVKDMEYRLATMEAIKEPIVTAVATLAKAVMNQACKKEQEMAA